MANGRPINNIFFMVQVNKRKGILSGMKQKLQSGIKENHFIYSDNF